MLGVRGGFWLPYAVSLFLAREVSSIEVGRLFPSSQGNLFLNIGGSGFWNAFQSLNQGVYRLIRHTYSSPCL